MKTKGTLVALSALQNWQDISFATISSESKEKLEEEINVQQSQGIREGNGRQNNNSDMILCIDTSS